MHERIELTRLNRIVEIVKKNLGNICKMSLSTGKQFPGDAERNSGLSPISEDREPVPQQLKEIIELMSSVNRRLEDCAVEWQSAISRKQWRILDAKPASQRSWEQSLLARTYFTEKPLDEAFQCLLVRNRIFTEQLNNFVALLRGDEISAMTLNVRDAESQCPDTQSFECHHNRYPVVAPLDLSLLEDHGNVRRTRKSKRLAAGNAIAHIQQSFVDLVKAKINLDTKFLGFEAVLNETDGAPHKDESSTCLCQICTNVLGNAVDKGNVMKSIAAVRQKVQRVTRARSKRLTKSSRTWARRKPKSQTVSLDNIGDQATMITARSYRETIDD